MGWNPWAKGFTYYMKRHGNLYEKITTYDNIYMGYRNARRGKSWQDTIKRFEAKLDTNIKNIQKSLIEKTYTTSNYSVFTIHEPKTREIYRLPYNPDRVVQHSLMNVIEPIWEGLFIRDSFACRKNLGIHAGSKRLMDFIRRAGPGSYCLKMDISKFYPSVDHEILYKIMKKKIKCKDTLWLLEDIVFSVPGGKNVPIGNYTSQWFGNLYMNEVDQYLKHHHHVKYYMRYCDDFLILHPDKDYLNTLLVDIEEFLFDKLELTLSKKALFPVSQGIDFLGYRHFPEYILLRKSTQKRFKKRIQELPLEYLEGKITKDQYRSSLASMMGWLRWCNSHNLSKAMGLEEQWRRLCGT